MVKLFLFPTHAYCIEGFNTRNWGLLVSMARVAVGLITTELPIVR